MCQSLFCSQYLNVCVCVYAPGGVIVFMGKLCLCWGGGGGGKTPDLISVSVYC